MKTKARFWKISVFWPKFDENFSNKRLISLPKYWNSVTLGSPEDLFHKSHDAPVPYPTMHHFVTEMCICVHISVTKWYIVGYLSNTLWNLHYGSINSLRLRRNGCYNADDIFKCIFLKETVWNPTKISLKFVPKGPINNIPALVQIMAWRRPGDKPLPEPMMVSLLTYICVTWPQWVSRYWLYSASIADQGLDHMIHQMAIVGSHMNRSRTLNDDVNTAKISWWISVCNQWSLLGLASILLN